MLTTNHVTSLFDMNGRIALVTGGVQGLGWQAGEALSEAGATVILTSRNERKAQAAADKLQAQTGNAGGCPWKYLMRIRGSLR